MGANKTIIKQVSVFESLIVAVAAYLVTLIFLIIAKFAEIPFFSDAYENFSIIAALVLFGLLVGNIALINLMKTKKLFKESINISLRKM